MNGSLMQRTSEPQSDFFFAFILSVKIAATVRLSTVSQKLEGVPGTVH